MRSATKQYLPNARPGKLRVDYFNMEKLKEVAASTRTAMPIGMY